MNDTDSRNELEQKMKRRRVNRVLMVVVAVLIAAAILFAIFVPKGKSGGKGTATLSIQCTQLSEDMSQLNDPALAPYVPADGMILPETEHAIVPGQTTVFDLLTDLCKEKEIQIEYNSTPVYGGSYIEGLGYLYEFSAGKYSGWKYTVNGQAPSYAADKVKLSDGDEVVWYYSVDYRDEGM